MNFFKLPDRYRDRHSGRPGILVCRSPWVDQDLAATPDLFKKSAVWVGVNHSVLKVRLDYCFGGDPAYWRMVGPERFPNTEFITHDVSSWHLPKPNVSLITCTARFSTVSSIAALWFSWYLGLDPIRVCGAHFRVKENETGEPQVYGDVPLSEILPDRIERLRNIRHCRGSYPKMAQDFATMVGRIRAQGTKVDWPGQGDHLVPSEDPVPVFDKTLIEPNHQGAYGGQGARRAQP